MFIHDKWKPQTELSLCSQAERSGCDANILSLPVPIRRGGSESNLDVVDSVGVNGIGLDFTKGALGIDKLQQKILKVCLLTFNLLLSVSTASMSFILLQPDLKKDYIHFFLIFLSLFTMMSNHYNSIMKMFVSECFLSQICK